MNRNLTNILAFILVSLVFGFLTGCGSSSSTTTPPPPTLAITATSGSGQTANVGDAFTNMLVATVKSNGTAASGVAVTFTPVPGAVGQSCTPSATTVTTASDGTASITCTANSTPGAYSVTATATATGITATASFAEGNTAPRVLVFYVNGLENSPNYGPGPVYYAVAGAVGFDLSGKILGGEQDYNDGSGFTSPGEPTTPDVINPTGSSMTVDTTTGTGTLVLDVSASNPSVGVNGIETFAVQFINASHALITQFDGSATSSGSFDLQTARSGVGGNFAFTLSGLFTKHSDG